MNDPVKFEAQKIKNFQKIEFKGKIDNKNLIYLYGLSDNEEPGFNICLLYTSPSPRDRTRSRMPSSA